MFEFYQLRSHKIHRFEPKISIREERGHFLIKTVSTQDELIAALRLRYQVFHREMIGKTKPTGLDVDRFDFHCDHLIITDTRTSEIIGTYRLNCSKFSDDFYSEQEFHVGALLDHPGIKLELGRACIHKDYRNGAVISLLWRGIAEYMVLSESNLLFGCASIKTESPRQAALLYHHFLNEGLIQNPFFCPPSRDYQMSHLGIWIEKLRRPLTEDEKSEVQGLIPPLCRAYLKAGAFVGGEPAYDAEFRCIDFLTILPRANLNSLIWKKFGQSPPITATEQ